MLTAYTYHSSHPLLNLFASISLLTPRYFHTQWARYYTKEVHTHRNSTHTVTHVHKIRANTLNSYSFCVVPPHVPRSLWLAETSSQQPTSQTSWPHPLSILMVTLHCNCCNQSQPDILTTSIIHPDPIHCHPDPILTPSPSSPSPQLCAYPAIPSTAWACTLLPHPLLTTLRPHRHPDQTPHHRVPAQQPPHPHPLA